MNSCLKNIVICLALAQVVCGLYLAAPPYFQNLPNLLFTSHLDSQDPLTTMACFGDYIAKSSDVGETYSQGYKECLFNARAERQAIEIEMSDKRMAIAESSQEVCKILTNCDGLNNTSDVFTCHAKVGANTTKEVYIISSNASEYVNIMQENHRIIDLRHEQCCKAAERTYVEATAVNYRALQDCLDGRAKPSSTATTIAIAVATTTTATTPKSNTVTSATSPPMEGTAEVVSATEAFDTTISDMSEGVPSTLLSDKEQFINPL